MTTNFVTYYRSLNSQQKKELATACKTSVEYLSKQAYTLKDNYTSPPNFSASVCDPAKAHKQWCKGSCTGSDDTWELGIVCL